MSSGQLHPFPVTRADFAESIASSVSPAKRGSLDMASMGRRTKGGSGPSTAPGSTTGTPPMGRPPTAGGFLHINSSSLSPSKSASRRSSLGLDNDSRRSSVSKLASDVMRKGVRNVTDSTKKATDKVKDKTAGMGAHVKVATVGASKWVASHTSKTAKAAMDQAKSGLSIGEKLTLFAFEKISVLSRRGFTHFFMLGILIGYTALGAILFMACESAHEKSEMSAVEEERETLSAALQFERTGLIRALWDKRVGTFDQFAQEATTLLEPYDGKLYASYSLGDPVDPDDRVWTFWKSMFFCSTITTTIGYGHITPKTTAGRALTIIYSIIGIPIFLILMADFGKLFTRMLKHVFIFLRRVYSSGTCVRARKHPTVQGIHQNATGRWQRLKDFLMCRKKTDADTEKGAEAKPESPSKKLTVKINRPDGSGFVVGSAGSAGISDPDEQDQYFTDGNFDIPISLALFILLLYMITGCIIYISWEPWTFFQAFYFIFVSMTTIGFGDFVPEHPAFMMATALYLLFGLALTAMCINIIQEKLSNTFREASIKLKESFSKIMEASAAANQEEGAEGEGPAEGPAEGGPADPAEGATAASDSVEL